MAERIDALSRRLPLRLGERQAFPFDEDPAKKVAEKAAEKAAEKPKADANNGGGQNDAPVADVKAGDPKTADAKDTEKPAGDAKALPIDLGGGLVFRIEEGDAGRGGARACGITGSSFSRFIRGNTKSTATYDADRRKLEVLVHPNNNLPYPLDGFLVEEGGDERGHHRVEWIAGRSRHTAARHRAARDSQFRSQNGQGHAGCVCGRRWLPGVLYPVMVNGGAIATPSTATFRRVRTSPVDAQVFKGDPDAADPFPILGSPLRRYPRGTGQDS